jgi:hypothetical protein
MHKLTRLMTLPDGQMVLNDFNTPDYRLNNETICA